jgi:hypothetical protein
MAFLNDEGRTTLPLSSINALYLAENLIIGWCSISEDKIITFIPIYYTLFQFIPLALSSRLVEILFKKC